MGAGASSSSPALHEGGPPPTVHADSFWAAADADTSDGSVDMEARVACLMGRDRTPPQMRPDTEGRMLKDHYAPGLRNLPPHLERIRYHRDVRARERTKSLFSGRNPTGPTAGAATGANMEDAEQAVPPSQQRRSCLSLAKCPKFPTLGVSMRVVMHFAAELRKARALLRDPGSASAHGLESTRVCEVWEMLVSPVVEPFDFGSLTEITQDVLDDLPVGLLNVAKDIGPATHFVVVDHDTRYLELAGALARRFPAGTPSQGVFLWIDQFCFPHEAATAFPASWFMQGLDAALREIGNLILVLQDGDGFDLTSEPKWRRPPPAAATEDDKTKRSHTQPLSVGKPPAGVLRKIEALVPIALAHQGACNTFEVLQDADKLAALRRAVFIDLDGALNGFASQIKSLTLADDYPRTKYFHAAGLFTAGSGRHSGLDASVGKCMGCWVLSEAKKLLADRLKDLDMRDVAGGGQRYRRGSADLPALCSFAIAMARHLRGSGTASAKQQCEDVLRLVLDAASEALGTLSTPALAAADRLIEFYSSEARWNEAAPLVRRKLARARARATKTAAEMADMHEVRENEEDALAAVANSKATAVALMLREAAEQDVMTGAKIADAKAQKQVRTLACKLGRLLTLLGNDEEAHPLLAEGSGSGSAEALESLYRRALEAERLSRSARALSLYGQIIKDCDQSTHQHPAVLWAADIMATHVLTKEGNRSQGETLYRRICKGRLQSLGEAHLATGLAHRRVALMLLEDRRFEEARSFVGIATGAEQPWGWEGREFCARRTAEINTADAAVAAAAGNDDEGNGSDSSRPLASSAPPYIKPIPVSRDVPRMEEAMWQYAVGNYFLKTFQDTKGAIRFYRAALSLHDGAHDVLDGSSRSPQALTTCVRLGSAFQQLGDVVTAKKLYRRYLTACGGLASDSEEAANVEVDLAWCHTSIGAHTEAEPLFRRAFVRCARKFGENHKLTFRARARLADCLEYQGRRDEAATLQGANAACGHFQTTNVLLGVVGRASARLPARQTGRPKAPANSPPTLMLEAGPAQADSDRIVGSGVVSRRR